MFKYLINGEEVRAYISEDEFYCTNSEGEGLFHVIVSRNARYQIIGTCDFSVRGLTDKSKKAKIRQAITPRNEFRPRW